MLNIPESIFQAFQRLVSDANTGKISLEQAFTAALQMDPDDHVALQCLARIRCDSGDREGAREYLWRAIEL